MLDVCDIGDDPYGYAYLSTLLAERASGPYSVAIAADSDQRLVPALLTAAGWALAYVDGDATDDFAERFADELSEEVESAPMQRRALGLARALHAGALSATLLPAPAELAGLKPALAAHGALSTGRHAAAVALREVLRELYPAALRAYPDPADPVALAVMDALPEPGALASSMAGRGRDAAATADAVTAQLATAGVADQAAISEAITALRVAIAETPRRGGINKGLTATVAETVRQSVAAVRACDAACTVLVRALAERVTGPVSGVASSNSSSSTATARASVPRHQAPTHEPSAHQTPARQPAAPRAPAAQAATHHQQQAPAPPAPAHQQAPAPPAPAYHQAPEARPLSPAPPPPMAAPTRSPAPAPAPRPPAAAPRPPAAAPRPPAPAPATPASPAPMPTYAAAQPMSPYPVSPQPTAPPPVAPPPVAPPPTAPSPASAGVAAPRAASAFPRRGADRGNHSDGNRPVSAPPPPPPGITPIAEPRQRPPEQRMPDLGYGESPNGSMAQMPVPRPPAARDVEHPHPHHGMSYGPPPGSRSDWPTSPPAADARPSGGQPDPLTASPPRAEPPPPARPVTPPWQADDLRPPEPPVLRLVEPTLPAELREELGYPASDDLGSSPRDPLGYSPREDVSYSSSRDDLGYSGRDDLGYPARDDIGYSGRDDLGYPAPDDLGYPARAEQPSLRLVEPPGNGVPRSAPPVSADDDDTLLIFAQTRSAWFSDQDGEGTWGSALDVGWRAAEQAARQPTVGERTDAGLPRRVPRANLVPGSPPSPPDRSLRVVRDPRSIAEHTSGYFNGWRRGQEIGGYPLGGRQQAAGAWDFSRDDERLSG